MDGFEVLGTRLDLLISGWLGWGGLGVVVILLVIMFAADSDAAGFIATFFGFIAVIALIFWVVLMVPFDSKYHKVYAVEGTVTSVSNVLSESGGDLTRVPVLEIDTLDRPVTVEDPRAVTLEGKPVSLICDVEWVFRGADRYDCRIAN